MDQVEVRITKTGYRVRDGAEESPVEAARLARRAIPMKTKVAKQAEAEQHQPQVYPPDQLLGYEALITLKFRRQGYLSPL
jgi:hypothetical protein